MYLSRLIVHNFKSIKNIDIRFERGKNVVVGHNNSGKSNIVKAIDLVLGEAAPAYDKSENVTENDFFNGDLSKKILIFAELTRDTDEEMNYDEIYKCFGFKVHSRITSWTVDSATGKKFPIKEPIRVDLHLDDVVQRESKMLEIMTIQEDGNSEYINPKLRNQETFEKQLGDKYRFGFLFSAQIDNTGKIIKSIRLLYKENESSGWILTFSASIRNELIQSAIIPSFRDPQNQLRISNWSWYGKLLKQYVKTDNERLVSAFREVKEASNEVFGELQNKINNSRIKIAFPNTEVSFQFNPDAKQDVHKNALIYVDDGYKSQLQDKGAGIQSAIIIGLFHFYTQEIAHVSSSLLAIEEPELYLHPHGRRVLSNRLDDFIDGNKNQVIVTTHASEFLNSSQEQLNIIIVNKEKQSGTTARNVFFNTAKEKQILIKNQNTEMFFADRVILVEGGGDKYVIESISSIFGEKDSVLGRNWLNDTNTSIIPVVGKTEFWKYAVKLKESGIKYFIIPDFDFFRNGLSEYLTKVNLQELKDELNSIRGKIGQELAEANKLSDLSKTSQEQIALYLEKLTEHHIFVLNGQLEDYYTNEAKTIISGLSGKEERALHLVSCSLEEGKSIEQYVDTGEYFRALKTFINSDNRQDNTDEDNQETNEAVQTAEELEVPF